MKSEKILQILKILLSVFVVLLAGVIGFTAMTWMSVSKQNKQLSEIAQQFKQDPKTKIDERAILGTVFIERLDLEYPVIKHERETDLNTTICAYSGPGLNQYGNTVIAGKRSKGGLFFTDLVKLKTNDTIRVTGADGASVTYRMTDSYETDRGDNSIPARAFEENVREITLVSAAAGKTKQYVFKFVETE